MGGWPKQLGFGAVARKGGTKTLSSFSRRKRYLVVRVERKERRGPSICPSRKKRLNCAKGPGRANREKAKKIVPLLGEKGKKKYRVRKKRKRRPVVLVRQGKRSHRCLHLLTCREICIMASSRSKAPSGSRKGGGDAHKRSTKKKKKEKSFGLD